MGLPATCKPIKTQTKTRDCSTIHAQTSITRLNILCRVLEDKHPHLTATPTESPIDVPLPPLLLPQRQWQPQ